MKKEKIIVSLIIMMLIITFCSISVFADTNSVTIITANSTTNNTSNNTTNNTSNDTTNNTTDDNTSNTNSTTNDSTSDYTTVTTTSTTDSSNETTNDSSSLPYTGTSHAVVFVIIALVISAIYAYKKVSDYNI